LTVDSDSRFFILAEKIVIVRWERRKTFAEVNDLSGRFMCR
jgi:hypothetical protein